ncbi:meiotically up-regulated protein [Cordyceps fumosorosea ARSEF 2679]|uniref:Meiotically up-regulated protein n=1 Tax=Cordyceps fumosorosea (strain ARSEF 2679) TaxID=1081104 RepID=A0A168EG60_CORFA|nr:meiotically up-regulated protein [Cordyceps fumosorosea ARSEF 2679]OAA73767.1 meiotically up-regulated protein [Cordyceps fumosorosea ARSEF 2679]
MGASQSTSQGDSGSNSTATKTCYYELIGVDRDASEIDIKKAYRKRALELHPDRNFGDAAAATQKFAELQSAYEILSDPHERAWYDSHRDAILGGQDITGDGTEPTSFRNVRITSAEEIMSLIRKFNSSVPFNDDPVGFFTIARETFEHLALEEEVAAEQENVDAAYYTTFGQAEDSYDEIVKPFYASWAGFATKKTFAWKDKYRLSDAPDRHTRRLMDKANRKLREDAAREFNDAVRFLVTFVRKRDSRYIPNTQTEAQRQEAARVAASAQAARDRAANQERMASFKLPDWATSRESHSGEEEFSLSEVESEVEILECVVCDKNFRSEKQLEAHERSKKHLKAAQQLRWQMRKEGVELQLNENSPQLGDTEAPLQDGDSSPALASPEQAGTPSPISSHADGDIDGESLQSASSPAEDDDYAPRETIVNRILNSQPGDAAAPEPLHERGIDDLSATTSAMDIGLGDRPRKIRKAKAKRERKAAAAQANTASNHPCTVCKEEFDSRTKLFAHIRTEGHAATPRSEAAKTRKKKNR